MPVRHTSQVHWTECTFGRVFHRLSVCVEYPPSVPELLLSPCTNVFDSSFFFRLNHITGNHHRHLALPLFSFSSLFVSMPSCWCSLVQTPFPFLFASPCSLSHLLFFPFRPPFHPPPLFSAPLPSCHPSAAPRPVGLRQHPSKEAIRQPGVRGRVPPADSWQALSSGEWLLPHRLLQHIGKRPPKGVRLYGG